MVADGQPRPEPYAPPSTIQGPTMRRHRHRRLEVLKNVRSFCALPLNAKPPTEVEATSILPSFNVKTARRWRGIVPSRGRAYESHLRTAGIAGRTKRCGGGVAARGARSKPAMRVMATPCSRRRRSAVDNRLDAICKSLGNLAGRDALLIDRRGDAGRHLGQTADVAQADGRWQASHRMML